MNRTRTLVSAAALLLAAFPAPLLAGPGHDHGDEGAPAAEAAPPAPRFEAASDAYEIVGRVEGDALRLWLDRWASNEPVTKAGLTLTVGQRRAAVSAQADGTYLAELPEADSAGTYPVLVTVAGGGGPAVLAGQLVISDEHAHDMAGGLLSGLWPWVGGGALVLVLAGGGLWLMRRRRAGGVLAGLAVIIGLSGVALEPPAAWAHEGHDHGEEAAAPVTGGDQAVRLPDGDIVAPKPMQRLIGLRTMVTQAGAESAAIVLNGQVVADPNASGVVQAQVGGRVSGRFPALGQSVARGQALGVVTPAFDASGAADLATARGQAARDLASARIAAQGLGTAAEEAEVRSAQANLARLERLEGVVPQRQIEEARTAAAAAAARLRLAQARARAELSAVDAQVRALGATAQPSETLRAPVSGVVSAVNVAQGQVVAPGETLFSIIRPGAFLVEAQAPDSIAARLGASATGRTGDGRSFDLARQGAGLALMNGAAPVRFTVLGDVGLRVGDPVSVFVASTRPMDGVAVPREAVVRGPSGQTVVYVKESAERVAMIPVATADLDAARLLVTSGLSPGQRVVTTGAGLLAQVR